MTRRFEARRVALLGVCVVLAGEARLAADETAALLADLDQSLAAKKEYTTVDFRVVNKLEARFLRGLDEKFAFNFVDAPLNDVMDYLAQQHEITIRIDEPGLVREGIAPDEPIDLKVKQLSLRLALRVMLEPLGLTYVIEDDVLKITTQIEVEHRVVRYTYDVRELEQAGYESNKLAEIIRTTVEPGSWERESKTVFSPDSKMILLHATDGTFEARNAETGKVVWHVQHGRHGCMQALPGCLVVRARQDVHDEIVELLRRLQYVAESKRKD